MTGKTDWTVAIHAHASPKAAEFNRYYAPENESLHGLLQHFKNGTTGTLNFWSLGDVVVDFTTQGQINLVGYFTGHTHADGQQEIGGINYSTSNCTAASQRTSWPTYPAESPPLPPEREDYSYSAMSLNCWIINPTTKTVNMVKLGAGNDAVYSYDTWVI